MSRIALLLVASSITFGLLKIVTSEQLVHVQENELPMLGDVNSRNDKDLSSDRTAIGNRPRQMPFSTASSVSGNGPQLNFIECYSCTNCPTVLLNTTSKICPLSVDLTKRGCVVYAEKYKHMNTPWYIRGCASERGSCADIRRAHEDITDIVTLLFCTECDGDKCNKNSASHSVTDFTIAFIAMVATPVFAKYMLS